jgi:hypothetical protein
VQQKFITLTGTDVKLLDNLEEVRKDEKTDSQNLLSNPLINDQRPVRAPADV